MASPSLHPAAREILKENKELFSDEIPKLPPRRGDLDFKIELEPGARPPAKPPYRLSYAELEEMKKQLKDYVDKGFIRLSMSPFGVPAFFVEKKDGTFCIVIDYRPLNKVMVKDIFPLPCAEKLMETLFGKRWFIKLDLRQFFHQLRIAMENSYKTAFVTRWGTFEWLVMPFGVLNAPPASMRLITLTMRPALGQCVIIFIDDILVYSRTLVQHVKDVKWVLDLLRANNLYIKIKKCKFFTNSTHFLRFVIDAKGIMPECLKLELIRDSPDPKDLHELQIFLGAANWVRKFVRGVASIVQLLTKALKKGMKFTWTEEMKTAFSSLKEAIINITSLYIPDPERPFKIFGNVFEQRNAFGGALMQQDPCVGWLRPVAFASRTLMKEEKNYPIREKELLAVIFLLKHWCPFVSETMTMWTDHESLKTLDLTASYAEARGRVRRWMSFLQELGLKLKYLPGAKNILTDTLSRHPPSEKAHAAMGCEICLQTNSSLLPDEEFLQKVRDGYREDKFFQDALFFLSLHTEGQKREEPPPFLRF
uniref:Reverse transcriptase domain-containing protein n=1 Tax=Chromera velia CCMP2878 TaxID=1169474 RepID=A0A0G4HZ16_9ALVE|eukprot:Cvel_9607.t1-p1 / transcript=Cvel_9607.t1 / gene=Cvel_9607 / organism=Chromera_velia_CCMP2878 / gene_product=Transposon Ty3-G Gag-Pol polyprotein, putative / transcript_product=Transposon Ty3-G Gag-Pol polyprotein, putative / location=Cvel_scaffold558:35241-36845(+) / protein_length=535 / sequence_SO=supercontig / SO=protein_coding / is_pseudo=false